MAWLLLSVACLLAACGEKPKTVSLGNSQGLPWELLLIVDPTLWNSDVRDSLESVLQASVPALPQNEPLFRMMRIFPENYSGRFAMMRNIIEVREDPEVADVEVGLARNVKARPQVYVSVRARGADALKRFLSADGGILVKPFVDGELAWEGAQLARKYSKVVDDASREIFGCSVKVPAEIGKTKKGDDFLWASTDRNDQDLNYVCYAMPLADEAAMMSDWWVAQRDSAMKRNIPGSTPENWMTTTYEGDDPLVSQRALTLPDGRAVYEMRGLWEMRKGALGGPFVSLAFPDSAHGRMLVAEGFVYSPRSNKRNLVRRMEAALRTLVMAER